MLLTRAPLYSLSEESFLVRLACVKHAASVRSEPGSNSSVQSIKKSTQGLTCIFCSLARNCCTTNPIQFSKIDYQFPFYCFLPSSVKGTERILFLQLFVKHFFLAACRSTHLPNTPDRDSRRPEESALYAPAFDLSSTFSSYSIKHSFFLRKISPPLRAGNTGPLIGKGGALYLRPTFLSRAYLVTISKSSDKRNERQDNRRPPQPGPGRIALFSQN